MSTRVRGKFLQWPLALSLAAICLICLPGMLAGEECPLKGKWLSHETLTLQEMKKAGNLTPKQVQRFSDGFFDKPIMEVTFDEVTSYYDGKAETMRYKIVSREKNRFKIISGEELLDPSDTQTIELKNNCLFIYLEHLDFNEVLCRMPE